MAQTDPVLIVRFLLLVLSPRVPRFWKDFCLQTFKYPLSYSFEVKGTPFLWSSGKALNTRQHAFPHAKHSDTHAYGRCWPTCLKRTPFTALRDDKPDSVNSPQSHLTVSCVLWDATQTDVWREKLNRNTGVPGPRTLVGSQVSDSEGPETIWWRDYFHQTALFRECVQIDLGPASGQQKFR